eukprot:scaffold29650_cov40-Tisochrysis_lutea.AAC.2
MACAHCGYHATSTCTITTWCYPSALSPHCPNHFGHTATPLLTSLVEHDHLFSFFHFFSTAMLSFSSSMAEVRGTLSSTCYLQQGVLRPCSCSPL